MVVVERPGRGSAGSAGPVVAAGLVQKLGLASELVQVLELGLVPATQRPLVSLSHHLVIYHSPEPGLALAQSVGVVSSWWEVDLAAAAVVAPEAVLEPEQAQVRRQKARRLLVQAVRRSLALVVAQRFHSHRHSARKASRVGSAEHSVN